MPGVAGGGDLRFPVQPLSTDILFERNAVPGGVSRRADPLGQGGQVGEAHLRGQRDRVPPKQPGKDGTNDNALYKRLEIIDTDWLADANFSD